MEKNNRQAYFYFAASLIFSYGFLLVLINGYYHYNYLHFLDIGRKDLIARLGFLTYVNGFIFYPTVIIPIIGLTLFSQRQQRIQLKFSWLYSLAATTVIGILLYTETIDGFLYRRMEYWVLGLLLMTFSIPLFWSERLLNKIKRNKTTPNII